MTPGSILLDSRSPRRRVTRMQAHQRSLAVLAIPGGIAARDAAVVFFEADIRSDVEARPNRRFVEGAAHRKPDAQIGPVRTRPTRANFDAARFDLAFQRFEVRAGFHVARFYAGAASRISSGT